jgi:Holliday junction resolvasome RuvABC DNA-binding subunit
LTALSGVGEKLAMRLVAAGFGDLGTLGEATPEALQAIEGIGPKSAEKILLAVREALAGVGVSSAVDGSPVESREPEDPASEEK